MRTIHKIVYGVESGGLQMFELPKFSKLLHIRETAKLPGEYDPSGLMNCSLWYEVDDSEERKDTIELEMFGTGHPIPVEQEGKKPFYVGTFLPGARLVFHLYEWVHFVPPYESSDL